MRRLKLFHFHSVYCVLCTQLHCVYSQNNLYKTINFQYIYAFFTCAHSHNSIFHSKIYTTIVVLTSLRFWLLLSVMLVLLLLLLLLLLPLLLLLVLLPFSFSFNKTLLILCANKYINMVGIPLRAALFSFPHFARHTVQGAMLKILRSAHLKLIFILIEFEPFEFETIRLMCLEWKREQMSSLQNSFDENIARWMADCKWTFECAYENWTNLHVSSFPFRSTTHSSFLIWFLFGKKIINFSQPFQNQGWTEWEKKQ